MKGTIYIVRSCRNSHVFVTMGRNKTCAFLSCRERQGMGPFCVSATKDKARFLETQRPLMGPPATLVGMTRSFLPLASACAPVFLITSLDTESNERQLGLFFEPNKSVCCFLFGFTCRFVSPHHVAILYIYSGESGKVHYYNIRYVIYYIILL